MYREVRDEVSRLQRSSVRRLFARLRGALDVYARVRRILAQLQTSHTRSGARLRELDAAYEAAVARA